VRFVAADKPVRHRKIGAYRVLGELGRGGMAQVYRGLHEQLQREVALKEMLADPHRDMEAVSRFRREALALAAFRHQNIVSLYDLVEKNDVLFMVMEFVDGPTLQELIREGPLPAEVAAVIAARITSALEHAHLRHIVHRDLKPANVMLAKCGEVKLMDFGVAKDAGLEALTAEGMAVGTPSYMSPEQVTGTPVDPRTDLFALGVLLYEMLVGTRPFLGRHAGEVFARIREGKYTPLGKIAPQVPRPLVDIVRRALQTKPEARYPDAAAMRRDLELFLARRVDVSHEALLIGFLRHRQKLTESEALTHLSQAELSAVTSFERPARSSRRLGPWWLAVLAVALGLGAGAYASLGYWMEYVRPFTIR
jgi:eukaryotic-like serine/threonine-protein kinase